MGVNKFTFKTDRATGRYRSFYPDTHHIKLKRKKVGTIDDSPPYKISFTVYKDDEENDKNPNCKFKHITLVKKSESLIEAKEFLNKNIDILLEKYKLYSLED